MEPRYYETSQGARKGQQGIEFEKDISTLSLKILLEADLQDFLLGREKKGVGKFDDICVVYEKIAKKVVILAQLKHKDDENEKISYEAFSKNRSNDFFLPKYFESLEQIKKSLEEDEAFKGTSSNILFICTNIGMEDDLKGIEKEQVHGDFVLFKECGKQIKLRIMDKQVKKEIFQQSYKSKQKRLAEEMVNSTMHQKTIDIPSMIKNEVVSLFKDYHKPLAEYVIDGSTGRLKSEFLNPSKDEVKNLRDCFYVTLDEFCNKYGSKDEDELKFEFSIRDKEAQELRRRLEDYRSRASTEAFLESHRFKKPNFCCKVSGEIASRETLPPDENIDENKIDSEIDEFLDKLIFVTDLCDVKGEIKRNILPSIYIKLREKIDQWFDDVTKKTNKEEKMQRMWLGKKELLSKALEMNISFQGIRIKLNQLLGGNQNLLTSDLLLCVFGSQENQDLDISVGRPPEQTSEMNYYVSRKIFRKLQNEVEERFTEKDLVQKELASRILTIVGEPGMGKTTFLQNIASKFVQSVDMDKRPTWIIFVPLITCKNSIKDLDTENLEQIIGFFSHLENCKDEFSETLLKDFIMGKGEMKIILDGLDELSELEQEKIIDLVQVIVKKTRVDQVWLTARTHLKQKLEINFKEVSFTLDELKGNDQVNLLVKYWKYTSPHLEETYLNNFAHKLIEKINLHIDTRWQAFLGIPLQAYLIAFVFQGEIVKENLQILDSLTMISLYDRFVDEKFNVYFRKFGLVVQEEMIKKDWKSNWNKCFESLALSRLIINRQLISCSQEEIMSWFNFDIRSVNVDILIKIGIVYKEEGTIYFIHQTFVKYFVDKLFADACQRKLVCQIQEKCIELMCEMLYPYIYIYIYRYLISRSRKSSMNFAVLNGKKKTVEQFSEREINTKDCLGRTALYYALCYNQYNILKILFQEKIHVDLSDKYFIFSWYSIVCLCLYWFYFYFSDWPTNVFSRLALQVEIALQIDQKRNVVTKGTTHYFNPSKDIDVGDLFTNHGIRNAATKQIIVARLILQEMNRLIKPKERS